MQIDVLELITQIELSDFNKLNELSNLVDQGELIDQ
jgi:hypothetical protein